MHIIGILGRSRVGKDTVATFLAESLGYSISRLASPIKGACRELFGFTAEQMEGPTKEHVDSHIGCTPRECMVWLTEHMRAQYGPTFFMDQLFSREKNVQSGIVIPDVRYASDMEAIRRRGGIIIKVSRKHPEFRHDFEDHIDTLHGDIHITNDGTIEDLRRQCAALFSVTGRG